MFGRIPSYRKGWQHPFLINVKGAAIVNRFWTRKLVILTIMSFAIGFTIHVAKTKPAPPPFASEINEPLPSAINPNDKMCIGNHLYSFTYNGPRDVVAILEPGDCNN